MDDESFEGHQNGRPRRHDGRDPWLVVPRARVFAELPSSTTAPPGVAPAIPAPGDLVSVLIERAREDTQGRHEEIWLEVVGLDGDTIHATFDSQPTYVRGISAGDALTIDMAHVLVTRKARRSPRSN